MRTLLLVFSLVLLSSCATTEFKSVEEKNIVFEGKGGTKTVVDGMDIWKDGEPPHKFKVLGFIFDQRSGAILPLARLYADVARKAREVGGSALIQLVNQPQVEGYYTVGAVPAYSYGDSANTHAYWIALPFSSNVAKFAVISDVDSN